MNTQTGIAVALAVAVALIFLFFGGSVLGLFFQSSSTSVNQIDETTMSQNSTLQIADTVVGTGEMAEAGDTVSVHYVGVFQDGTAKPCLPMLNRPGRLSAKALVFITPAKCLNW